MDYKSIEEKAFQVDWFTLNTIEGAAGRFRIEIVFNQQLIIENQSYKSAAGASERGGGLRW